MSFFQFLMLAMSAYFSFQVYKHIQNLEDEESKTDDEPKKSSKTLEQEADELYQQGDLQRAFELLDEANVKDPKNSEILSKMGFILGKSERNNEAISYYQEALHVNPNDDTIHIALASLYKKVGEYEKAQKHYEEALKIDDSYDVTYYNYGNLLAEQALNEQAIEMYEKALKLNPDFQEAKEEIQKLKGNM
jgi:tetratricopeptide (TPR) repeat protein